MSIGAVKISDVSSIFRMNKKTKDMKWVVALRKKHHYIQQAVFANACYMQW